MKNSSKLAKQMQVKLPTSIPSKIPQANPLKHFQEALLSIHSKKKTTQNGYETVIASLQQVVE